jgi:exonuclease SbcC
MKINKIILHNIQKHEHLVVEFDKNLTAITGESDRGKSSILRALGWVLFNKPSSNELRRKVNDKLTNESYVILYVTKDNEQHVIERYVSDKLNTYSLDGAEFKSFKRDVPKPISDLFNLDYRINFQKQFDTPFLVGDTSGEAARMLNDLLGLEEANELLELINKDIIYERKQRDAKEVQLEDNKELLKLLEDFSEYDSLTDRIMADYENVQRLEDKLSDVNRVLELIERANTDLERNRGIEINEEELREEVQEFSKKEKKYKETRKLIDAINNTPEINVTITIDELREDFNRFNLVADRLERLEELRHTIVLYDIDLSKLESELDKFQKEVSLIKICPTCNRPME